MKKTIKKYQKGGPFVPTPNPKTISPFDNQRKQKSILEEPKEPVKPTPPSFSSYRMKKGGSVIKSKKK
jgi:hypothetical protein